MLKTEGIIMLTKQESLENFSLETDDLIKCNYILADNKISEIMKTIASSKLLYELFGFVTKNFDYDSYRSVCFSGGAEGANRSFSMPERKQDVMAFTLILLYRIDTRQEDLLKILDNYFKDGGTYIDAYKKFTEEVILPFRDSTLSAAKALMRDEDAFAPEKQEKPAPKKEKNGRRSKTVSLPEILEDKQNRISAKRFNSALKEEALFIIDSFKNAYINGDEKEIAVCWLAYKYFSECNPKFRLESDKIYKMLKNSED